MSDPIIFCEGEHDRIFLHETLLKRLNKSRLHVKSYSRLRDFNIDMLRQKQAKFSIVAGNGWPRCMKIAVKISRDLWYKQGNQNVGVVADSDRGAIFDQLSNFLTIYLKIPGKVNVIQPKVNISKSKSEVLIELPREHKIKLWTLAVPSSLEIQIAKNLRRCLNKPKYGLENCNEDEVIRKACEILEKSKEEIMKNSVGDFKDDNWYNEFCKDLKVKLKF